MLNFQPAAFPGAVLSNSDHLLPLNVSVALLQSFFRAHHLSERGLGAPALQEPGPIPAPTCCVTPGIISC